MDTGRDCRARRLVCCGIIRRALHACKALASIDVKYTETNLKGVFIIELERLDDARGFFARTYCAREFAQQGLATRWVQASISVNLRRGTLRGMHYQAAPNEEIKLVRCTQGAIHDVIIDLRADSPTFRHHAAMELTADNRTMLYVPGGFAHGFMTLADNTEVFYQMSEFHVPSAARGVRWDDPAFAISWPNRPEVISERDATYPDFQPEQNGPGMRGT